MAAELQPYQERVVAEKKELDEKIAKLDAFIGSDNYDDEVDEDEQARLESQLTKMQGYSAVLGERIAAWDNQE